MSTATTEHISAVDTAKLVRKALRRRFPGVRFSVRTSTYSGGASVRVGWTDGPTSWDVDAVVKPYAGAGFDGSIDLRYHTAAWLHDDGTVTFASTSGTEGSRGSVPSDIAPPQDSSARLVRFGAHYVTTCREVSDRLRDAAEQVVAATAPTLGGAHGAQCRGCGRMIVGSDDARAVRERPDCGRAAVCSPRCGATVEVRWGRVRPSTRKG